MTLMNLQPINLQILNLQSLHLKTLHLNWLQVSFRFDLSRRGHHLKLGLSHLEYVPATTRATMSRLGAVIAFEVDGVTYAAPSHEMPGEVEWRADYMKWMVRRFVHYLARKPKDEWVKTLLEVEAEAVQKQLLLNVESQAFAEGVLLTLQDLSSSDIQLLATHAARNDVELKSAGEALTNRLERMLITHGSRVRSRLDGKGEFKMKVRP